MPHVLVHYHELALKGRNRRFFEQRLVNHLRAGLKNLEGIHVEALPGRIRVSFADPGQWSDCRTRLRHTFGIANFSLAYSLPAHDRSPDLAPLKEAIAQHLPLGQFETFRILTKRAEKRFPKTSIEIDREIGAYVCQVSGKRVNLTSPDLTIAIEVLRDEVFFSFHREPGPGGLPTGTSGTVLGLISGGIDSPVAAYRLMKRGCRVCFVHFHGRPFVSRASEEKVRDIIDVLTRYQLASRAYFVPFGQIQRTIVLTAPPALRIVLYRRMMMRIAEELAARERAWGLVTGDSLGQVASQTPENLAVVTEATTLPLLRPLIGMDKQEITEHAIHIGTYDISIEPDEDCCRLFTPPHPSIKTQLDQVRKAERALDIATMIKDGLAQAEFVEFRA
ncbi:MAG: tRNA 4-thiouridine(8) synthase ThiI [Nitrospirae bacterium]|nr:MAG: tRNA 4-thiouridine(8) synthase ThiI [Nitrospirota bacterium]